MARKSLESGDLDSARSRTAGRGGRGHSEYTMVAVCCGDGGATQSLSQIPELVDLDRRELCDSSEMECACDDVSQGCEIDLGCQHAL